MPTPRKTIALRSERVVQLREMANANHMPLTEYLEELIRKQARREDVQLPGLMVYHNTDSREVVFGFKRTNDGESIPLSTLTPDEARLIAKHLQAAMATPRRLFNPIETSSGKLIDIGRQGVAATLNVILSDDQCFSKSLSRGMVQDVCEWLKAAAKAVDNL